MGLTLLWLVLTVFMSGAHGLSSNVDIMFQTAPDSVTSAMAALFRFSLRDSRGTDPCGNCSIRCKLDDLSFTDCSSRRSSYSSLRDGQHTFQVFVNTLSGVYSAQYTWIVDTVPPTASVIAGPTFTNALNVSVNVSFSEPCTGKGGFRCSAGSDCNLLVYGPGQVIPETLRVIQPDLKYNIIVSLSTSIQYGRVILVMDRSFCTDSAGNRFQRTGNSSAIIHYDRRNVFSNLWTAIPDIQLEVNNEVRTVEATNNKKSLKIYVDFTAPLLNSSAEILRVLQTTAGVLYSTKRKTHGNRRFGYVLKNLSSVSVVNINLETSSIISRQGTPVAPTIPIAFLYDSERPTVKLSTISTAKTTERTVPILIQFMKPVFHFNSSAISISGGLLKSFREITRSAYVIEVNTNDSVVSVKIPENGTVDVAGNPNLASNLVQVRHYTAPTISVFLYSFTTAAVLSTSLAAGALTISTASLEAAGVLSSQSASLIVSDPSRNLLRMVCHLQVYALCKWLGVKLPIKFHESLKGLQWVIPHLDLPWERSHVHSHLVDSSILVTPPYNTMNQITGYAPTRHKSMILGNCSKDLFSEGRQRRERKLGINASMFGQPLLPMEYKLFFERQGIKPVADFALKASNFDGWKEFKRNIFWLIVIGGGLMLVHILILLLLQLRKWIWRTDRPKSGALVIPRFEMFLLILALPCMCQAAAFLIKDGSIAAIIIGALLLGIPTAILLSAMVFISVAIIMGVFLQYKEVDQEIQKDHWYQNIVKMLIGPNKRAEWILRNNLRSSFIIRFGLLFEDLRGPSKVMLPQIESVRAKSGRDRILTSNDGGEDAVVPMLQNLFGILRIYYTVLDLARRMALGIIAGAYCTSESSRKQILVVFSITTFQLLFLVVERPYISRRVQIVEIISVSCEAGFFALCLFLLAADHAAFDHKNIGFFMICLLLLSFIAQLINEWHALTRQLLRLPPTNASVISGMKIMGCGLLMVITPQRLWKNCACLSPSSAKKRESSEAQQISLPCREDLTVDNDSSTSSVPTKNKVFDASPEKARRSEGKWCSTLWPQSRSNEIKMLRELAKASFPSGRGDDSLKPDYLPSTSSRNEREKVEGQNTEDPNDRAKKSLVEVDTFIQQSTKLQR